jgi:hypothetical protein
VPDVGDERHTVEREGNEVHSRVIYTSGTVMV